MSEKWMLLCVEEDDRRAFLKSAIGCGGPLELGRQDPTTEEPLYQLVVKSDESSRLAIAPSEAK